ncbi:MAG TPA: argininosuccinate lyase [Gammaproteobacteria bacterium]|nr:argininosuccinate lyase [Gammaproteobacteria bacterium]|tara:strand:- start:163 stop:1575 length:1413 start_codon:yes stop_codon:yes gene_type:complete
MSQNSNSEKPWGGRFKTPTNAFVERFTASVKFDQRLAAHDIKGSIAHAEMLAHVGIISRDDSAEIVAGLKAIESDIADDKFEWSIALEDVHMNIEHALVERIGDVGKKLHTARSRNDQVATDIRLFLREQIDSIVAGLETLMTRLIDLAEREAATLMPGYTHLQTAQPISFGHHMLAWFEMLMRDRDRFIGCRERVNVMPLGAGALAGTTFPIDRSKCALLLGFAAIAENSIDAVSDRDFAIEFAAHASMLMMHFSRMSEEVVLWSSQQFSFVELSDEFCTGSSMMPQKKNPDVPELVRGKSGRVFGHFISLITLMKSQPLAYNKDNQEDKEPLFDTVDTLLDCIRAFADLISSLTINAEAMRKAVEKGFVTATDLADYLVRLGLPFRDAHGVVGNAVRRALDRNCDLCDLTLAEYQEFYPAMTDDVYKILDIDQSLDARTHFGAASPRQVLEACERARQRFSPSISRTT